MKKLISEQDKQVAQWAMETALTNGCSAARVSLTAVENNVFEYRNLQLDKLLQSSENKLYVELFVDGRYGSFSTNRIDKEELKAFIKENINSTRLLAEDPCRQLPDASRYYCEREGDDLDLYDQTFYNYTADQKLALAEASVKEIYGTDDRIVSVSATYDDACGAEYTLASNGFESDEQDTVFTLWSEVALKTDSDARPEGFWQDSRIFWSNLQKEGIARTALDRALRKLGQQKVKSGKYNMLLDNTVSYQLLAPIVSAMNGRAIQQKNTFLLDRLNTLITSDKLTVIDSPHTKRTFGSRWFDGEGVATREQAIIEKGVLNTYFIDTYNAHKLNATPTIASASVLKLDMGNQDCEGLQKAMNNGIWVTGFNGGNTNGTTGDFSFGVEGFLIENGIVTTPINEMNITGNILDLWANLSEIGNDPYSTCSSRQIPSLLFENVSFSGL